MLIHASLSQRKVLTKVNARKSSKKDFTQCERIYRSKVTKICVKEPELQMHVSQRLKMYEHVGKAFHHYRRRSDERQIAPHHKRTMDEEKSLIKDHKA
jgi:hypothetical protein